MQKLINTTSTRYNSTIFASSIYVYRICLQTRQTEQKDYWLYIFNNLFSELPYACIAYYCPYSKSFSFETTVHNNPSPGTEPQDLLVTYYDGDDNQNKTIQKNAIS